MLTEQWRTGTIGRALLQLRKHMNTIKSNPLMAMASAGSAITKICKSLSMPVCLVKSPPPGYVWLVNIHSHLNQVSLANTRLFTSFLPWGSRGIILYNTDAYCAQSTSPPANHCPYAGIRPICRLLHHLNSLLGASWKSVDNSRSLEADHLRWALLSLLGIISSEETLCIGRSNV